LKGHKSSPALRDEDKDENEILIANNKKIIDKKMGIGWRNRVRLKRKLKKKGRGKSKK